MPGYLLKQEQVEVDGVADLFIRCLLDRQQFADPQGEAEALGISPALWPLFGLLWPSGRELALALARRPLRADETILEIGCGLALASLVVHRRGARVTASDVHPLAEAFLQENLRLNGLPPLPYRHGDWAAPGGAAGQRPGRVRVSGRFDLIMGSDVLYERDEPGHLAGFIGRHGGERGEVLIVDPNRGNRAPFERRMRDQGYTLVQTPLKGSPGTGAAGAAYAGRLLHFSR